MTSRRVPLTAQLLLVLVLSACGQPPSAPSYEEMTPTAIKTETPSVSSAVTTPKPEVDSQLDILPTPFAFEFPTAAPKPELAWRPPPYPVPWAISPNDHFYLARPIPSGDVNWPHPYYRYGNTYFGESSIHTGVDLGAERGTPVLAAGPGEVVWAGYGLYRGTYDESDPYGLAVAIRHDFGYQGQELYSIYGHMESIAVWEGQKVEMGEMLGTVGSTGHSEGPHLHFEVRLGENRYFNSRNPELWMVPPSGWAVLAGLVLDSYDRLLPEQMVQIYSLETGDRWDVWTYSKETIHADDYYGENFVISDLPAGPYKVAVNFVGRSFVNYLYLYPGQTNFFTFRGRHGYVVEASPTAVDLSRPPDFKVDGDR
jgi:murein DD-endopeptidase MepM/ murein hydrolase activator NlpD